MRFSSLAGTMAFHRPADFVHASFHNRKAQAGPTWARGEKRLKNLIQLILGNAASLILNQSSTESDGICGASTEFGWRCLRNRLQCVHQEVGDDIAGSFFSSFDQARP